MIETHDGRSFSVFIDGRTATPKYYAHTHCWCGSTLGGGEWWPTLERAVAEAKESIADHEKRGAHAAVKQ